ncbi:hypothetical protein TNCV_2947961 [Trichonephila clavipes]|nr:hypothetical protein TNCV_2947961 [Trichonephila clavipes]
MQILHVPEPPVQILHVSEPVQIPLSHVSEPPVQIPVSQVPQPPVQIPVSPVQIPVSQVPQSPVQISDVPEHVHIPLSQVPQPTKQILHVPEPRVQILHVSEPVQIPVSQVPQSPVQIPPVQIPDVPEYVQIPVSQVPQSPVQFLHVPEPPVQIIHVSEPVQIPVSQVPQSLVQILPEPMQILPDFDILDPLESTDAFDQLMSFVFGPQELQLLHTVPSIFDGNLLSFLDEFEWAPMDLKMPRLNSCVKKSIGAIQPMDLDRAHLHAPRNAIHEHEHLRLVHTPLPKSAPVEYLPFCVRGKLSQMGRGGLMVVKGTEQQKIFLELGVVAMSLETLPEFNAIYGGTFPHSLHEEVHEDVLYCTMVKSYQFAKYLQQFNKLQEEWSHKVSILQKIIAPGKRGMDRVELTWVPFFGSNSIPRLDRSANVRLFMLNNLLGKWSLCVFVSGNQTRMLTQLFYFHTRLLREYVGTLTMGTVSALSLV